MQPYMAIYFFVSLADRQRLFNGASCAVSGFTQNPPERRHKLNVIAERVCYARLHWTSNGPADSIRHLSPHWRGALSALQGHRPFSCHHYHAAPKLRDHDRDGIERLADHDFGDRRNNRLAGGLCRGRHAAL